RRRSDTTVFRRPTGSGPRPTRWPIRRGGAPGRARAAPGAQPDSHDRRGRGVPAAHTADHLQMGPGERQPRRRAGGGVALSALGDRQMVRRSAAVAGGAVVAALVATRLIAQASPAVHVALGFGVDTARSPNRELFALYQHYLAHRLDSIRPNPDWSSSEQQRWPVFDLVGGYVYQGFPNITVVQLAPAVGLDSTYLIRALGSSIVTSTQPGR